MNQEIQVETPANSSERIESPRAPEQGLAGRELDVAVARALDLDGCDNCGEMDCLCREVGIGRGLPRYSSEIGSAMEVVEKVRAMSTVLGILITASRLSEGEASGKWLAAVLIDGEKDWLNVHDESLPVAICRAALATVNAPAIAGKTTEG